MTDFLVSDHGSIVLLAPLTDAAEDWVDEHLPDDVMMYGHAIVIEHRFFDDIAQGILADGLTLG